VAITMSPSTPSGSTTPATSLGDVERHRGRWEGLPPSDPRPRYLHRRLASAELLTIDVTVARDYLDPRRAGHINAATLFELARQGEIELTTAPQGYRLDVEGDLAEQLRATFSHEDVSEARQLAYVSEVTFVGDDLIVGHVVEGFADAWNDVVASWRTADGKEPPQTADRFHVETHVIERRDVFLTSDRALRSMCRRLAGEHGFSIVAMTVADYLERHAR
jgi:hypothetical protein